MQLYDYIAEVIAALQTHADQLVWLLVCLLSPMQLVLITVTILHSRCTAGR
jgi:hypothetical protein